MEKKRFNEFMSETKSVDRWFILKIAIIGAFAGAVLTVMYMLNFIII